MTRGTLVRLAKQFIRQYPELFGLDVADLDVASAGTGEFGGYLWYVQFNRTFQGIPIEKSYVTFRVNHGNLVQFGGEFMGAINIDAMPTISVETAQQVVAGYLGGMSAQDQWQDNGVLSIVPLAPQGDVGVYNQEPGRGVDYRLVYTLTFRREGVMGTWQAKVDAHTGEVLSFVDANEYGSVKGSIYVTSNLDTEVVRPMPYAGVSGSYANAAGVYPQATGAVSASFTGKYVKVTDSCGTSALAGTAPADLNFGTSTGTDCTVPSTGGGAGNTHAARMGYYHSCTGIRDADYTKHTNSTSPATPAQLAGTTGFHCTKSSTYPGPCGYEGHCESYIMSEVGWDLAAKDLPAAGFDANTSWYIADRLFFLTRPTAGDSYTCSGTTANGCGTSNWHQVYLVADDDNGNLTDGTPHAAAIYAAFNRHLVACTTSVKTNSTTCGSLGQVSLTATAGSGQVVLSWAAVSGASKYQILRNELGATAGMTPITTTTATSYTDTTVAMGVAYFYTMGAVGSSNACFGALSTVQSATPGAGATYSISGTVSGAVTSGVTLNLTGAATATTTTATGGTYTFSGLSNGSYTVTPSLSGYTFSPTSTAVTVSGANVTGINFTSTATGGATTLFTNGFEASTGWAQVDTSGTAGTWSLVTSGTYPTCSKHGGTYMAKFNSYNAASGSATRYYRTTGFAVSSTYTTVTWTFWMYHDTGYTTSADKIQPQVSTNGSTWTSVGTAINRYDGSTGWKQHTVSISTYKGSTVYLGFLATSANGNNIYLDDALVVAQ